MTNHEPPLVAEPPAVPAAVVFEVAINHEQQYAIWPSEKPLPQKWSRVGVAGSREECLTYVRQTWRDMRPLSVRERHQADTSEHSDDRPIG